MIYICYGVTKSASTFLYQMTEEVFRAAGRPVVLLGKPFRKADSLDNYFNIIDPELLDKIEHHTGGADIVLKTHCPPGEGIGELVSQGKILASASIRDPREIALSMIDHGARSRRWRIRAFSEFKTLADTLNSLDVQLGFFREWAAIDCVKVLTYNAVCFDSVSVIRMIADQIGAEIDANAVIKRFRNKRSIGQYSKGKSLRYTEMDAVDQAIFLKRYASLYESVAFETEKASDVAAMQSSLDLGASGEFAQRVSNLRRRLRI